MSEVYGKMSELLILGNVEEIKKRLCSGNG